jgi:hypothetical protein
MPQLPLYYIEVGNRDTGDVVQPPTGQHFAEADFLDEKAIFRQQGGVSLVLSRALPPSRLRWVPAGKEGAKRRGG